ncbi:CHAT domain-containing protein [Magnetococcus sp. PR-3]|uniref:CHAT domain-containing protein n=1 Tax=Magnetococcus sp. PR-3 TaxID=3120355 RepID=UPI002FCE1D43
MGRLRLFILLTLLAVITGCAVDPAWEMRQYRLKRHYDQAITWYENNYTAKDDAEVGDEALQDLCKAYFEVRNYQKFMSCAERFFNMVRMGAADTDYFNEAPATITAEEKRASVMAWRSLMRIDMGRYADAMDDAKQALELLEKVRYKNRHEKDKNSEWAYIEANVLQAAGLSHAFSELESEARLYIKRLSALRTPTGGSALHRKQTMARLRILMALKDYQGARSLVESYDRTHPLGFLLIAASFINPVQGVMQAANLVNQEDNLRNQPARYLPERFILAKVLFETGATERAVTHYTQLLDNPYRGSFPGLMVAALHDRGRIAMAQGKLDDALEDLRQAAGWIEARRASIRDATAHTGYAHDYDGVYHDLINLLLKKRRTAEAFEIAERARMRTLVSDLAYNRHFIKGAGKGAELIHALETAEEQLTVRRFDTDPNAFKDIEAEPGRLRQQIAQEYPHLAPMVGAVGEDALRRLQKRIGPGGRAVTYYHFQETLLAFVVKHKGDPRVYTLNGERLGEAVKDWRRLIQRPSDEEGWKIGARSLYDRLWKPLKIDRHIQRVTLVADGPLRLLPWAALLDEADRPLMKHHTLHLLPSATALAWQRQPGKIWKRYLLAVEGSGVLSRKGRQSESERRIMALAFESKQAALSQQGNDRRPTEVRVLTGTRASEAALKRHGPSSERLHLDAIWRLEEERPWKSSVTLNAGLGEDGELYLEELLSQSWPVRLVLLPGIIAEGDGVSRGRGVLAMQSGWLYAGADHLLHGMWRLDGVDVDRFMSRYHRVVRKQNPPRALQMVQRALQRDGLTHPHYWATFQVVGHPPPVRVRTLGIHSRPATKKDRP